MGRTVDQHKAQEAVDNFLSDYGASAYKFAQRASAMIGGPVVKEQTVRKYAERIGPRPDPDYARKIGWAMGSGYGPDFLEACGLVVDAERLRHANQPSVLDPDQPPAQVADSVDIRLSRIEAQVDEIRRELVTLTELTPDHVKRDELAPVIRLDDHRTLGLPTYAQVVSNF